jgi:hypothetical protein
MDNIGAERREKKLMSKEPHGEGSDGTHIKHRKTSIKMKLVDVFP